MALVLYTLAVGACFHLFVVLYEERHLAACFGSQYAAYCSQVARWLPRSSRGPTA
jgi:protein-S-isoprenylcysteine O-methyltransferase Ste14